MAAPRLHVRKIMSHENDAMEMLFKTGVCTTEQLAKHFNIKAPRLKKLCHSQYLKQSRGKVWLDKKGINHLKKIGMEHRYKTSIRNVAHDLRLTDKYLSLDKEIRKTWKTESQLNYESKQHPAYGEFRSRIKALYKNEEQSKVHATPDAAIYSQEHGGYIAVEITTRNYKEIDIQQKKEFARFFLSGYTQD